MDHSLRGYLGRRTTEELDHILQNCLEQNDPILDKEVILIILDILRDREKRNGNSPPGCCV